MTIDQIVNYECDVPTEVTIENKDLNERLKLIDQLEEEDKTQSTALLTECTQNLNLKTSLIKT